MEFAGCVPQRADASSVMDTISRDAYWSKLYVKVGVGSAAEDVKKSFRCAVYLYMAKNGSSPVGPYRGGGLSGKGTQFTGAVLPEVIGKFNMRRFMRSNAEESVRFFRKTGVLQTDSYVRNMCEESEISVEDALALCDWLDGQPGLTPSEQEAQRRLKTASIRRANAARGGKGVDEIVATHDDAAVEAQASNYSIPAATGRAW
jgi:hypothetical protein